GALWRPGARPDVRGGDVPAPLLRGRARDDGAAQRVRAAEALRGACGGGRADLDGHAHVARARGALDAPGRTDVRRHRRSLREAGAELLEALPARRAAVRPVAVRARVVARRDGGVVVADDGRGGLRAAVVGLTHRRLRSTGG